MFLRLVRTDCKHVVISTLICLMSQDTKGLDSLLAGGWYILDHHCPTWGNHVDLLMIVLPQEQHYHHAEARTWCRPGVSIIIKGIHGWTSIKTSIKTDIKVNPPSRCEHFASLHSTALSLSLSLHGLWRHGAVAEWDDDDDDDDLEHVQGSPPRGLSAAR